MASIPLGSQTTDSAKTPTLSQYAKQREGDLPSKAFVDIIFKPNKAPNYTLVCENRFRVSVLEDNPLFTALVEALPELIQDGVALFVGIDDGKRGAFTLLQESDEIAEWEVFDWGYKISLKNKPSARSRQKTARKVDMDVPSAASKQPLERE